MPFRLFFEDPVICQLYLRDSHSDLSPSRHVTLSVCLAGSFGWGDCEYGSGISLELQASQCGYKGKLTN